MKDISAQEIDKEKHLQAALTEELSEMTAILKEATLTVNRSVTEQNIVSLLSLYKNILLWRFFF